MTGFALRLPQHILDQARAAAVEDNVSMNQLLAAFIAEGIGHRRGLKMIKERAVRADVGAALAILDRVPDMPADERDEIMKIEKRRSAD